MTETTPRVQVEVRAEPDNPFTLYDYGTGVGMRIGDFFGTNLYIALGWDEASRHEVCDRLIAVLTEARNWTPVQDEDADELERRDNQIDAGLGTGYIGEFR